MIRRPAIAYWPRVTSTEKWKRLNSSTRQWFSSTAGIVAHKPYFITTPIFYPNSDPHIGHLYSTVIADILARYALIKKPSRPVVFVTGTDEHGSKIQKAAHDQGMSGREQEFCDKISGRFRVLASKANLSHTRFIRTTEADHAIAVSHLWRELNRRGYIYKGTHSGWYSISDECFYTASQVKSAKDDRSSEPRMASNFVSKETGNTVEWSEEENYKFRLGEFRERLLERYTTDVESIVPEEQLNLIRGDLANPENVNDISISRPSTRLRWGIPVPDDPQHVIYVWLDALASYLTAVGYSWQGGVQEGITRGWPPDIQVIGKDILRFHTVYFPAFLLALDLPLPKTVLSHAHWTMKQMKMSKSVGNVADPFGVMDKYETDVVRYYLARVGGRFQYDNDWSEDQLAKHFQELFSLIGNQLSRAFSPKVVDRLSQNERYVSIRPEVFAAADAYLSKSMRSSVVQTIATDSEEITALPEIPGAGAHAALKELAPKFELFMARLEIAEALEEVVRCLRISNREFTNVAPWSSATPISSASRLLSYTRETLRICGILLQPFIPTKAKELLDALGVPAGKRTLRDATLGLGESPESENRPVIPIRLFRVDSRQ
ncbi:tRNA synthetases class I (M)-domain-containing protein [Gautieria morchelliformis]|nr:tRNA synthetases class I (M)-domain-containing protein [Gautieria morchelliformis]